MPKTALTATSTIRTTCLTSSPGGENATAANASVRAPAQSFCVPKADLVAQGYDLSLNRYKEVVHEDVAHRPPKEILADLAKLESDIQQGMRNWRGC